MVQRPQLSDSVAVPPRQRWRWPRRGADPARGYGPSGSVQPVDGASSAPARHRGFASHPRSAIAPGLARWPYLQSLGSDSVVVVWIADDDGSPAVDFGTLCGATGARPHAPRGTAGSRSSADSRPARRTSIAFARASARWPRAPRPALPHRPRTGRPQLRVLRHGGRGLCRRPPERHRRLDPACRAAPRPGDRAG